MECDDSGILARILAYWHGLRQLTIGRELILIVWKMLHWLALVWMEGLEFDRLEEVGIGWKGFA